MLVLDVLGWLGGLLVAGAYALVSLQRLAPGSTRFQVLNVAGAAMLGASCLATGAMPSACLNAVWLVFGARFLLVRRTRRQRIEGPAPGRADFRTAA